MACNIYSNLPAIYRGHQLKHLHRTWAGNQLRLLVYQSFEMSDSEIYT